MEREKVKEIKKVLGKGQFNTIKHIQKEVKPIEISFADILSLINELESQNKRLMQSNETLGFANDRLIERNHSLEKALFDIVVQFCQMDEEGYLKHTFMSAEENAFDILGIRYGEKVDDVYEIFKLRWGEE